MASVRAVLVFAVAECFRTDRHHLPTCKMERGSHFRLTEAERRQKSGSRGLGEGGTRRWCSLGTEVVGGGEEVVEVGGGGCPGIGTSLMPPPGCALQNGHDGKLNVVCILTQLKKQNKTPDLGIEPLT